MIIDPGSAVSIVIPVHNGWLHTRRAIQAIRDASGGPVAVVVVDDGSSDGTTSHLRSEAPDVTVLAGSGELWWSGGANVGCRYAIANGADILVLFNNDNYEISDGCFDELAELVAVTGGCASPAVVEETPDGRMIRHAGGALNWRGRGIELRDVGLAHRPSQRLVECEWLPGSALAFAASLFQSLGGFDDRRFPQYRGDIDFTLRARRAGHRCFVNYSSWVVNDALQSGLGFERRVSLRRFGSGFVSLKSNYNLREAVPFALSYCPPRLLPRYLLSFYFRYAYASAKTWLPRSVRDRLDEAAAARRAAAT